MLLIGLGPMDCVLFYVLNLISFYFSSRGHCLGERLGLVYKLTQVLFLLVLTANGTCICSPFLYKMPMYTCHYCLY
jgi:hypothetical protein